MSSICIQKLNTDGASTVFYIINVWWVNWEMNYLYDLYFHLSTSILCIVDWSLSSFICYCDIIWNRKIALRELNTFLLWYWMLQKIFSCLCLSYIIKVDKNKNMTFFVLNSMECISLSFQPHHYNWKTHDMAW